MAAKRFSPSLLGIPEEETNHSLETANDYSQSFNSRRDSIISLKRENSRRRSCSGCPDCQPKDFKSLCGKLPEFPSMVACENCSTGSESKRNSIRKWLEDIPVVRPIIQETNKDNESMQSLPILSSSKRLRSPTRSLPPISSSVRAASPRAVSERIKSRRAIDQLSNKSNSSERRQRKPIVKPKEPPPPAPSDAIEHHYYSIPEAKNLPPPDMIHEAMAVEEETRIPTITKKNMNAVINEFSRNLPETHSDSVKRNHIDYETDSLERSSKNKGFSTPTEYADVSSSQPSPSLSTALPMDEEMTMRNAIINTKTGNMTISKLNMDILQAEDHDYELIVLKKGENYTLPELLQRGNLVSEVYVNNGYNYSSAPSSLSSNCSTLENKPPKVRYDNNKPGHLLIEVEDCPDNYIKVEDSDDFEPDTLDRKNNKLSLKESINIETDFSDSLERPKQILLKTTGSFKSDALSGTVTEPTNFNRNFGSLREIYEAKNRKSVQGQFITNENTDVTTWQDGMIEDAEGKILTLEERHSKRQRRSTISSINDVPPDVIPPHPHDNTPIYEQPKPPRKIVDVGKPPLPPKTLRKKAKTKVSAHDTAKDDNSLSSSNSSSDYECVQDNKQENNKYDASILKNFIQTDDIFFKNGINNQFILQAQTITSVPNLDRTVFTSLDQNCKFSGVLNKYLQKPEDSGYLSTDSDESRKKKCKEIQNNGSAGAGSETDESLCDGQSESGAESIETHSVFFDNFRKPCFTGSMDSGVDSDIKINSFTNVLLDDGASTDSENVSFKTVVTTRRS